MLQSLLTSASVGLACGDDQGLCIAFNLIDLLLSNGFEYIALDICSGHQLVNVRSYNPA